MRLLPLKWQNKLRYNNNDPKKVEAGKRLAEYNRRKREELAQLAKTQSEPKLTSSQYHGTGAIVAIGTLDILGYCIYRFKKREPKETPAHMFDLYQATVISVFVVGFSVFGKKIPKIAPPSM